MGCIRKGRRPNPSPGGAGKEEPRGQGRKQGDASPSAAPVARAQPGVIAKLLSCEGAWCEIATHGVSGAIPRRRIWGLRPGD